MSETALPSVDSSQDSAAHSQASRYLRSFSWIMAIAAMALVGVKPLFDIPGEKVPQDTVDPGMLATTVGAFLMVASFAVVAATSRSIPTKLVPALVALMLLGMFSVVSLLAMPAREDFLQLFAVRDVPDLFGPYVSPVSGILTQGAQLAVGFAPITLLALMLLKPHWFSAERLRWVLLLVVLGAIVHSVIAWLQVVGVVPYSFFFRLPGGDIGRASGAYFHPASLGRLLIFAVFILYAAGDRLRLKPLLRYATLVTLVATAVVSTHRITIVCVAVIMVAFEARRFNVLLRQIRGISLRTLAWGGVALVVIAALLAIRWGAYLWERGIFLLTQVGSLDPTNKEFLRGRGEIWFQIADVWRNASLDIWLLGMGYEPWNTHSDPVRIFVVWGLLGLVLMATIFVNVWRLTRRAISVQKSWMLTVVYIVAIVSALTQKPTSYSYFMWLFFLSHMLIIAFFPRDERSVCSETGSEGGRQ